MNNRTNNPYASPYAIEEPHLFYGRVNLLRSIFQKLMLSALSTLRDLTNPRKKPTLDNTLQVADNGHDDHQKCSD